MGERSKVILREVTDESLREKVRECMELCDWQSWVSPQSTVVIKPNLCTIVPVQMEKSNTDLKVTQAVCEVLLSRTNRIFIGEADHLRRTSQQAFDVTGHTEMAKRLGINVVNFTEVPRRKVLCEPVGEIEMPSMLLDADVFITLPALKTHALTYFTGALKNQWGCVPQHNRILLHKYLDAMLASLERMLHPKMSLMDGIVAMEGRGPVNGGARRLNVILASRDSVAIDATAMRLVGLDPPKARHVGLAAAQGLGKISADEIDVDGDWSQHQTQFKPGEMDWAIASMLYMSNYPWFVKYILENDYVFYPIRSVVKTLRKVGVVGGG
ncbi:MAG: DUF362 domain-containing protein [Acidobacteriota bacterium]|nr:DUF362 domain-containing protein [Acidobacteriota bacterium]